MARRPPPLRARAWRPGDEAAFTPRADFARARALNDWDWTANGAPGPTWTLYRWGGEIVGVGGAVRQPEGHWVAWAQLAPVARRDWPQLLWLASRFLARLSAEVVAHAQGEAAGRCLARLGFARAETVEFPPLGEVTIYRREA